MDGTFRKRYAVVSCHVERVLDDRVWEAFSLLQERRPGGFVVAALLRPPDTAAGEAEEEWLVRARAAASRGPLGLHTHWTSPTHARPLVSEEGPGDRVRREGAWLRDHDLEATSFCGGGWYTDAAVAAACSSLGYVDCTPRAIRPRYLPPDAPWAELAAPARIRLADGGVLLAIPSTHTLGGLGRAVLRPSGLPDAVVHVYFHDSDLLDGRRRRALAVALSLLGRRRHAIDLNALAAEVATQAPEVAWQAVARGGVGPGPQ